MTAPTMVKIFLAEDEVWPHLYEVPDGWYGDREYEVPADLVERWRAARDVYWHLHGELLGLTTRKYDR